MRLRGRWWRGVLIPSNIFKLPVIRVVRLFGTCVHTDDSVLLLGEPRPTSIDLSKATKLTNVRFCAESMGVEWITEALQTVTLEHRDLRQISIHVPYYFTPEVTGDETHEVWLELDRLLVQLWESHSIHPKVTYPKPDGEQRAVRDCIGCLFPEITTRGLTDLVK